MDMIEKVAREILAAHDFTKNDGAEGGWETLTPDWQECFRAMARAAIEAMREPTEAMRLAPASECRELAAVGIWQQMIDAALTEPIPSTPDLPRQG